MWEEENSRFWKNPKENIDGRFGKEKQSFSKPQQKYDNCSK